MTTFKREFDFNSNIIQIVVKNIIKIRKEKKMLFGAARIKQHKNVFRKRRSFGYAVSPFCRSISKDAGSIPTRS